MKGKFITIEGTDGAGKSTQIELLVEHLKSRKFNVIVSREPGGTDIGEKIRNIILDVENSKMANMTEIFLYAASRAQHMEEKIIPEMENGAIIICDRFADSSFVYQGYARGISLDTIDDINKFATKGIEPDLTLFFDLPPEIGIERKRGMQELDRMENERLDFHKKVYEGYKDRCRLYPNRIKRIDAQKTIEDVHKQVVHAVNSLFEI